MPNDRSLPSWTWPDVDSRDFGQPFEVFPVESPFAVRPDLVKLTPPDDWLRVDREWRAMLAAKLSCLAGTAPGSPSQNIMLALPCDDGTQQRRLGAISRFAANLAATDAGRRLRMECTAEGVAFGAAGYRCDAAPGNFRLHVDRRDAESVVRAIAAGNGAAGLLASVAMSLQEDLVLMEQGPDGIARAVVFHVCFPSAWDPAAKLGQDLLALHAPVADNALLQSAARRLGKALVEKGPFVRWVWTVTPDPRWRAWPPSSVDRAPSDSCREDPLYFRLERQTTMPLGEGYGLFLIRVQVRPLAEVLAKPGRLALLQASLRSMSADMVRYKSLEPVRTRILQMQEAR